MKDILLITVDCLRADFGGLPKNMLNSVLKDSLYFTNAYSHSSWTAPAFKSLFTSTYPLSKAADLNVSHFPNIPQILNKINYKTTALLYGYNDFVGGIFGYRKIFDHYEVYDLYDIGFKNKHIRKKAKNFGFTIRDYIPSAYYLYLLFNALSTPVDNPEIFYKKYRHLISDKRRVFLWTHIMDVHEPYYPKDIDKKNLFEKIKIWSQNVSLLPTGKKKSGEKGEKFKIFDQLLGILIEEITGENLKDITPEYAVKWLKKWYMERIKLALDKIRMLIDIFYEIRGDGLVIVTADHGQEFMEHGYLGHCIHLYEELIKVPLIVIGADSKGEVKRIVTHGDLLPTIINMLNYELSYRPIGYDLFEDKKKRFVISETAESVKEDIHTVIKTGKLIWEKRKVAVVTDRWKYIRDYYADNEEFYDLKNDPEEKKNIIEESPESLEDLRLLMDYHMKKMIREKRFAEKLKSISLRKTI